jgi:hypothetical protein
LESPPYTVPRPFSWLKIKLPKPLTSMPVTLETRLAAFPTNFNPY